MHQHEEDKVECGIYIQASHWAVEHRRNTIFRWNLIFSLRSFRFAFLKIYQKGAPCENIIIGTNLYSIKNLHSSEYQAFDGRFINSLSDAMSGKLLVLWRWNTWWCNCVDFNSARNISIKFASARRRRMSEVRLALWALFSWKSSKSPAQLGNEKLYDEHEVQTILK